MTCTHDRSTPGPGWHYSDGNHERCGHCGAVRARHFGLNVWGPWRLPEVIYGIGVGSLFELSQPDPPEPVPKPEG